MKAKHVYVFIAISFVITTKSQDNNVGVYNAPSGNYNELYVKENINSRKPIPYTSLREADVAWEKRIWREIDMREKQNFLLYFPLENIQGRSSLFQALTKHILNGDIIAFADEEFLMPYERSVIRSKLVEIDTVDNIEYDKDGGEIHTRLPVADSISIFKQVLKFRVKEDWFFDRQKSTMEVRIIGLAAYQYIEEKEAYKELFWVYFPACRPYFATSDVFNSKNDSERRSLDDIFWKRQFSSTIIKESNVYDRYISEYEKGIGALMESDRIKTDMFKWEHDLWHF